MLADARTGRNGRHALVGLLRQSVFGRLAGYEDVNDADRCAMIRRCAGSSAARRLGRCGLAKPDGALRDAVARRRMKNLSALTDLSGQWIDRVHGRRPPQRHRARHGFERQPDPWRQEMSVWNGHFACTCYHPLFVFNQFGDLERCALRPGNVHSADGWQDVLEPVVARYRGKVSRLYFRADAAFAIPEVYEYLEAERIKYAIRLPANRVLQEQDRLSAQAPGRAPPNDGPALLRQLHAIRRQAGPSRAG